MSLITIAQRVADEVGLPRPSQIATGTDQLARQMFALANSTIEELSEDDWPSLRNTHTFNTVIGQQSYSLPADFLRMSPDTAYAEAQKYRMKGSSSPADWRKSRVFGNISSKYEFLLSNFPYKFHLTPTPSVVEAMVFDYVRNVNVLDVDGVSYKQYFTTDTDTPLVPELVVRLGLKWRIKHAKGLDYSEDYNRYEASRKTQLAQMLAYGAIPVAVRHHNEIPELTDGYVPENGYG